MIDREAVRSNAKYLRQVRPIDPEEIAEYIEDYPHPAVVKQTLREEAFDLGLIEKEDGTFVPVPEEPVDAPNWNPAAVPDSYCFALEDLLVGEYGANWHVGESGDRLREAIRRLKADYFYGNAVEYDQVAALGYAIYHLPDYYAVVGYVLETLAERGLLDRQLRVLDVGAGSGGPALGLSDFLPADALVEYHAIEPSASTDILSRMLEETGPNFHTTIHETTIESYTPADGETFDLILFGNVLSELDAPADVVSDATAWLEPDGSIVAIEPADQNTAIGLRDVERTVAPPDGALNIYAPTLRLWEGHAPSDRGWSFDVRDDLEVPPFQQRLADGATSDETPIELPDPDAYINVDVQFAYSIIRLDGELRFPFKSTASRYAKMAQMENHVTERINLLAVKLSHNLSSDADANPLFKIGDGSETIDHYAVLTRRTALNGELAAAPYGSVLEFENVLVLWNDDEESYNLVVDDETVVDAIAGYTH